jgi:hypothetical protein
LTGQFASQVPQSTHSSALMTYTPSASEMQSTGQLSLHAPQPVQTSLLILNAIFFMYLHKTMILGFYHEIIKNQMKISYFNDFVCFLTAEDRMMHMKMHAKGSYYKKTRDIDR